MKAFLLACLAAAACSNEPAYIKVKLPKDSPQSFKDSPTPPLFRKKGERLQLRASAFNARETYMGPAKVKWSSTDPTVATVDDKGEVSIAGSGSTVVTASGDGEVGWHGGFLIGFALCGWGCRRDSGGYAYAFGYDSEYGYV